MMWMLNEQLTSDKRALRVSKALRDSRLSEGPSPREARPFIVELHAHSLLLTFLLFLKADSKGTADSMAKSLSLLAKQR